MIEQKRNLTIPVVGVAVGLNVAGAVILKTLADGSSGSILLIMVGVTSVFLLNALRFLIWMYAHKHFPLSRTYPLTSVFFPLMLGISYAYKEPVGINQWVGVVFITGGVLWLTLIKGKA